MIPAGDTLLIMEEELAGATAWAARHSVLLEWRPAQLELHVTLMQPGTEERFFLRGRFDNYRAVAPEWTFTDTDWEVTGQPCLFPKPDNASGISSIFHTHRVICVPFNRLAYAQHGGPHNDWGAPANWFSAGLGYVHADTVGDMLQVIRGHFLHTSGRMGA